MFLMNTDDSLAEKPRSFYMILVYLLKLQCIDFDV